MKKLTMLGIVLILVAASVVPVMAKQSNPGQGNQDKTGQGSSAGAFPGGKNHNGHGNPNGKSGNTAQGNGNHGARRMPFYLQGTITAIDPTARTITVAVVHANARAKQYIGTDMTLQTSDTTLYFQVVQAGDEGASAASSESAAALSNDENDLGRHAFTFEQLAVGQKVAVHGNLVNNVYTATLITVYTPETPEGNTGPTG